MAKQKPIGSKTRRRQNKKKIKDDDEVLSNQENFKDISSQDFDYLLDDEDIPGATIEDFLEGERLSEQEDGDEFDY